MKISNLLRLIICLGFSTFSLQPLLASASCYKDNDLLFYIKNNDSNTAVLLNASSVVMSGADSNYPPLPKNLPANSEGFAIIAKDRNDISTSCAKISFVYQGFHKGQLKDACQFTIELTDNYRKGIASAKVLDNNFICTGKAQTYYEGTALFTIEHVLVARERN